MTALPAVSTRKRHPLAAGSLVTCTPNQRVAVPIVKQSMSAVLFVLFIVCEPGMPSETETNGGREASAIAKPGAPPALPPLSSISSGLSRETIEGTGPISTMAWRLSTNGPPEFPIRTV